MNKRIELNSRLDLWLHPKTLKQDDFSVAPNDRMPDSSGGRVVV
jgi:hypothetical protein